MEQCKKEFFNILKDMDREEYMRNYLMYLIAPVIAGIKPSSTVTFSKKINELYDIWNSKGKDFLKELQLKSIVLRESDEAVVILIYNEEALNKTIFHEENIGFLNNIGYNEYLHLEDMLKILVKRYNEFHCPHELGIFLGIPLDDVKAFMDCSENKCLMCGYWKVYVDKERAEQIFTDYDRCKDMVIENILRAYSM